MPFHDPIAILGGLIGLGGGWRDVWDGPDDHAQLQACAEATERLQTQQAEILGVVWRRELAGTADALAMGQRSAGRVPKHCSRPAGR